MYGVSNNVVPRDTDGTLVASFAHTSFSIADYRYFRDLELGGVIYALRLLPMYPMRILVNGSHGEGCADYFATH